MSDTPTEEEVETTEDGEGLSKPFPVDDPPARRGTADPETDAPAEEESEEQ